jgi:hypothetical protein
MVRDAPGEAARVLVGLGYGVTTPLVEHSVDNLDALCRW